MHNALCRCLRRFAKQSGVQADLEEVCPALLQGSPGQDDCVEARLDVHLWGNGQAVYEEWVDVTVTHPWKHAAKHKASREDGVGAGQAEESKCSRYGTGTGGVQCVTFAAESWGRLGASACAVLDRVALQYSEHCCAPRSRVLRRWLAELGVAMCRAQAESVAQCTRLRANGAEGDGATSEAGNVSSEES